MVPPGLPPPRWPLHVRDAAIALREAIAPERTAARAALWPSLHAGLFASLRAQAGRITWASLEDLEDLASQKALELLLRAEEGTWDPAGRPEHEVAGYLAGVARHALVDLARRRGRECAAPAESDAWSAAWPEARPEPPRPEDRLAAREFARALSACVEALDARARQAWFRRVFLERPSREIAASLGVTAAHVDVIVQRARASLRACMGSKGHRDAELRPGAFAEIWARFGTAAAGPPHEERNDESS